MVGAQPGRPSNDMLVALTRCGQGPHTHLEASSLYYSGNTAFPRVAPDGAQVAARGQGKLSRGPGHLAGPVPRRLHVCSAVQVPESPAGLSAASGCPGPSCIHKGLGTHTRNGHPALPASHLPAPPHHAVCQGCNLPEVDGGGHCDPGRRRRRTEVSLPSSGMAKGRCSPQQTPWGSRWVP